MRFPALFYAILFLATLLAAFSAAAAQRINKIEITGAQRIEESTIASYMDVKIGDTVDYAATDRVLKSLFATGLFADVKVEQRPNGILAVHVQENPVINLIRFEGNDAVKEEELRQEIQLRARHVFTRAGFSPM